MNVASTALARILEQIAGFVLSLDDVTRQRLTHLDGRSIVIRCTAPVEVFTLHFQGDRINVMTQEIDSPSVIVEGNIISLTRLLLGSHFSNDRARADKLSSESDFKITGDELLLQEFAEIINGIQPDFESPLIPLLGEKPAQALSDVLDLGLRSVQSIVTGLFDTTASEVTVITQNRFLDQTGFDDFQERVQQLSNAVDRLSERLRIAEAKRAS